MDITALRLRKITGRTVKRRRKIKTTAPRVSGAPNIEIKSILARLYISPSPTIKPPIGIPNMGFLYVRNAIRNAKIAGNGCGKRGIIDNAKSILARVIGKIRIRRNSGSALLSFSLVFFFDFGFVNELKNPSLSRFKTGFSGFSAGSSEANSLGCSLADSRGGFSPSITGSGIDSPFSSATDSGAGSSGSSLSGTRSSSSTSSVASLGVGSSGVSLVSGAAIFSDSSAASSVGSAESSVEVSGAGSSNSSAGGDLGFLRSGKRSWYFFSGFPLSQSQNPTLNYSPRL